MNPKNLRAQIARQMMEEAARQKAQQQAQGSSFKNFNAAQLHCPKCQRAMPVKEKMLLVLGDGELYDYLCAKCGTSLGTRKT